MRDYELVLVISGDQEAQDKLLAKVKKDLEALGGKIEKEEEWGKKELAYRIKRETEGIYFFWEIALPPEVVANFEQKLKLEEKILRHLLVKNEGLPAGRQDKKGVKTRSGNKKLK